MDKWYDPVIVLGTGRSGTSAIAGILHHLGVHMGFSYKSPDKQNVFGYYEDETISQLNNSLVRDQITLRQWNLQTRVTLAKRRKLHVPWGWKHPMTADILLPTMGHVIDPWIVRCERLEQDTIDSFVKAYGDSGVGKAQAQHFINTRNSYMDKWLVDYKVLTLQHENTCIDPEKTVEALIEFIGLSPSKRELDKAIGSIRLSTPKPEIVLAR